MNKFLRYMVTNGREGTGSFAVAIDFRVEQDSVTALIKNCLIQPNLIPFGYCPTAVNLNF
jgi:hypothetical protein